MDVAGGGVAIDVAIDVATADAAMDVSVMDASYTLQLKQQPAQGCAGK